MTLDWRLAADHSGSPDNLPVFSFGHDTYDTDPWRSFPENDRDSGQTMHSVDHHNVKRPDKEAVTYLQANHAKTDQLDDIFAMHSKKVFDN